MIIRINKKQKIYWYAHPSVLAVGCGVVSTPEPSGSVENWLDIGCAVVKNVCVIVVSGATMMVVVSFVTGSVGASVVDVETVKVVRSSIVADGVVVEVIVDTAVVDVSTVVALVVSIVASSVEVTLAVWQFTLVAAK